MSNLESVWHCREEVLYPRLFGNLERGIFTLEVESFTELSDSPVDPRWLHLGVLEFGPTSVRPSWLYVTSGGSTPWDTEPEDYNEEDYSWLGVEFVLEAKVQGDWPVLALRRLLAYHVLACHGCIGDSPIPDYGHRIPAGGPIDGRESKLQFLAIHRPSHYPATAQLPSGKFDFLHVVGITESERDYAKVHSTRTLLERLEFNVAAPVTDPFRESIDCGA